MKPHAQYIFRLFDSEYYETLDAYEPTDELIRIVRGLIPSNWSWKRGNKWFYTFPADIKLPVQGWKIHISATPTNCESVLHATAEVCKGLSRNILSVWRYQWAKCS